MSTEPQRPLDHDLFTCPLPGSQLQGSIFKCECGRKWGSDGARWLILAGAEANIARPFAVPNPEPEEPKGRIIAGSVDQMRLHTTHGWAQWLVREPGGREWTLTLTGLRIEEGNHLAPWSQT